jgi:hypothetical protein
VIEILKRRNWTALGIDRIQDRQWKKLNEIWKVLERTMKWVIGRSLITPSDLVQVIYGNDRKVYE